MITDCNLSTKSTRSTRIHLDRRAQGSPGPPRLLDSWVLHCYARARASRLEMYVGIYPRGTKADPILQLKQEASLVTKRGHPVQIAFLDLAIDWDKDAKLLCYKTYDKRVDIKYDRTRQARFPSPHTMLWPTCMEGVFTSELHRFLSTCSSRRAFIITAAKCLYELYRNGLTGRF